MLWFQPGGLERVVAVLHHAFGLQQVQHGVGAVGAVVGVDQEVIDPDGAVIGQPLQDERALVLHRGHDCGAPARHRGPGCGFGF